MSKFDPSLNIRNASSERLLPSREFAGLLQAVLAKGADFRLKAKGMSMFPFICDGDILTIGAVREKARTGEVVAAAHPEAGHLLIHRIIAVVHDRCLIKGDANLKADGWLPQEKILGKVLKVEHRGRLIKSAGRVKRRLICRVSRSERLQKVRFSIYKRLQRFGESF